MDHSLDYLLLIVAWGGYFFLHSLLARDSLKQLIQRRWKISQKVYRLVYNIIAGTGLLLLLFYNAMLPSVRLIPLSGLVQYISLFLAGMGVIILNFSFRKYKIKGFLGFEAEDKNPLETKGILAYIRHPVYAATLLIVIGFFLYDSRQATLVSMICILIYLPVGIYFEEKKLVKLYGDKYRKYREKVPAIIPRLKSLKRIF